LTPGFKLAIVAALEREVRPLVRHWPDFFREHEGRRFRFFENPPAVIVCGGIGPEAARRATEAVIALYAPALVQSVGFAGALDASMKVGDIFAPRRVIDAKDNSSVETREGAGVLVSFPFIAGRDQKVSLAKVFGALAVDMESAAVARGAAARGIPFRALKAISDESNVVMLPLEHFIASDGRFRSVAFLAFVGMRPWLWLGAIRLARNSACASRALCAQLRELITAVNAPTWEAQVCLQ
jgi:adenosylhomocysteine nucleosidase